MAAQHDKCCYCESSFSANSPGDVEHFRPKASVQQDTGEPIIYPGYYWLAYRWENLFYSCEVCNRSGKRALFPLSDVAARLSSAADPPQREEPLLIDPAVDEPRDHIRFEGPTPEGLTERGRTTIRVLKLLRGALKVERVRHLKYIDAQLQLATLPELSSTDERRLEAALALDEALLPSAPFSALTRDYLNRRGWTPARNSPEPGPPA